MGLQAIRIFLSGMVVCLASIPVLASSAPPELRATYTESVITVDSVLNESAWQHAQVIDSLQQREPDEGAPAPERTEVRVLYSRSRLYVGIICFDSQPDAIVTPRYDRDADLSPDDRITLLFNTFLDHRNAFVFQVNAAGARFDQIITDEGQDRNPDWNGVWYARARRFAQGWTAEFAIPFQTLSFVAGKTVWGFNVQRIIKRRTEEAVWSGYRQNLDFFRVSEAGRLVGLVDIDISPFLSTTAKRNASVFKPGVDTFYSLTLGTLSLTLNTDFAETEVDDAQVKLTRFLLREGRIKVRYTYRF
jgi:hypothetical protein